MSLWGGGTVAIPLLKPDRNKWFVFSLAQKSYVKILFFWLLVEIPYWFTVDTFYEFFNVK